MFSLSDVLVNWWHWWCCSWRWCLLFVGGVWQKIIQFIITIRVLIGMSMGRSFNQCTAYKMVINLRQQHSKFLKRSFFMLTSKGLVFFFWFLIRHILATDHDKRTISRILPGNSYLIFLFCGWIC